MPKQNAKRPARRYSTDLTDSQWEAIKPLFDFQRKRKYDLRRDILDALFYLAKTGCQWRHLPREFAPWTTVYYYFRRWKRTLISRIHAHLRRAVRRLAVHSRSRAHPVARHHRRAVGQDHPARWGTRLRRRQARQRA